MRHEGSPEIKIVGLSPLEQVNETKKFDEQTEVCMTESNIAELTRDTQELEQIQQELVALFPSHKIGRMDQDTTLFREHKN
jgi:primosomal protein N'